ncbi:MAG: serpin family protein [Acidimicrobiales bacterium]|nr:serpin family protein [Acidimicrobiales bacterium]
MDRRPAFLTVIATLSLLIVSCGVDDPGQEVRTRVPRTEPVSAAVQPAVDAVNAFGTDLLRSLVARHGSENVVVSPYNVAMVLSMASAGASGATADQFAAVLHTTNLPALRAGFGALDHLVATRTGERRNRVRKGNIELRLAGALWAPRGTRFEQSFLDKFGSTYSGGLRVVDFRSDPDAARTAINEWARSSTAGTVGELAARGTITERTRMVGTAVTDLRAPWELPFDPEQTTDQPFTLLDGTVVDRPLMTANFQSGVLTATGEGWQAFELAFLGQELSILVVVPNADSFTHFITNLDWHTIERIAQALTPTPVDLRLPRFQFTTQLTLNDALRSLGLTNAFAPRDADFSGITTDEPLHLDSVLHQTFVSVDEEGTQNRAATVQERGTPKVPAARLSADRPFVFVIRDRRSGLVLSAGWVVEPNG